MGLKTRIWSTDAADEIRAAVAAARAEAAAGTGAPPPPAYEPKPAVRLTSMQKTIVGRPIAPSPRDDEGMTTRPKHEMFATRVAPIESLLGDQRDAAVTTRVAAPKRRSLTPAQLRRALIIVLAFAAGGMWTMRLRRDMHPAKPPAHLVAAPAHVPARPPAAPRAGEVADVPTPSVSRAPAADVDARRAVDALATGDFVAAERHYQALAQTVAGSSPFADAARILAARRAHHRERATAD